MQPVSLPIFTALGQQTRWRTFEVLLKNADGMLQGEIARSLGIEKNLMSVHLRIMREAGLVSQERIGREVTYRVTPEAARATAETLLKTIDSAAAPSPKRRAATKS